MKKYSVTLILLLSFTGLQAQDNDTADLRRLNVERVQKHVYVHAFQGKMDTCLYLDQQLDSLARPVYERVNMGCYGYDMLDEYRYTYDSVFLKTIQLSKNGDPYSLTEYQFKTQSLPERIINYNLTENDSDLTEYTYYLGEHDQPDSSVMISVNYMGDTTYLKTIARFDSKGRVVEIISMNEDREVQQTMTYELLANGKPSSVAVATYGEQAGFTQNYFEYDKRGRLSKSYNSRNQTQQYYYLDNGLIKNILHYNSNGELESEVIYQYQTE